MKKDKKNYRGDPILTDFNASVDMTHISNASHPNEVNYEHDHISSEDIRVFAHPATQPPLFSMSDENIPNIALTTSKKSPKSKK